ARTTTYLPRSVDIPATDGGTTPLTSNLPYQMQDFWVHLFTRTDSHGNRRHLFLGDYDSFFKVAATTDAIAERLTGPGSVFDALGSEYWAWAKNQVMEKTDVTYDGVLTNPCHLETTLVGDVIPFDYDFLLDRVEVDLPTGMSARVVKITIPTEPG